MNTIEKNDHLLKTKLALKSSEITDEQAEKCFLNTEVESEADIEVLVRYLKTYRPKLFEKLSPQ